MFVKKILGMETKFINIKLNKKLNLLLIIDESFGGFKVIKIV